MKKTAIIIFFIIFSSFIFSQQLNITSHTLKDTSFAKKYEMSAYYPQVDFGPDALMGVRGIAQDINTEIVRIINGQMVPFRQQSEEDNLTCPQDFNILEINYTIPYKQNGYICVLFETFSNPRCAAHPMTFQTSFNYSYVSKGLLTVDSLFSPGSGWLKIISEYCINELNTKAKNDGLVDYKENIMQGAGPVPDNFRTFTINEQYLTVIFNLYQVGPYVWGFQQVQIPWNKLEKFIDADGPVGFLVKK